MTSRVLAAVALLVAGCSELPPITAGQCGNGIIEANEDCDSSQGLCDQCGIICADPANDRELGSCPFGYTCGVDDMCTAPGGKFAPSVASVPFPVEGYRIVDVNADHFGDVIGLNQTALLTRYGDPRAELSSSSNVVTPPRQGAPALTHLDDSYTNDDLIMPVIDGLVAYTGAFGVPSPRQFPFNTGAGPGGRPDPDDVVQIDKTVAMIGARSKSDSTLTFAVLQLSSAIPGFDAETNDFCGQTYDAATFIKYSVIPYKAGATTYVALKPEAGALCVFAVTAEQQVRGSSPSCPDDPTAIGPISPTCVYTIRPVTSLPAVTQRPVFTDLDGDGCPSVIDVDGGANALLEYRGTQTGATCTIATSATPLPPLAQQADAELIGAMPLDPPAVGLRAEALITTYGIVGLSTATTPVPKLLYISDRAVEDATVGDLNSDGELDVVLTTSFPNLDIVRRVPGSDQFLLTRQSTTGVVTYTIVGDFDGDTRQDLAYAERLGGEDQLSISYGVPGGVLPGLAVDAFKHLIFLALMELEDSADPFSIVDDLVAIDLEDPQAQPEITMLHGSSNRTMLSFYGGPVPEPGTTFRGVAAGYFVESGDSIGLIDLFAFQTRASGPTTMHVIPGLPDGRLGEAQYAQGFQLPESTVLGECNALSVSDFCVQHATFASTPGPEGHDILFGIDVRPGFTAPSVIRIETAADGIHVSLRNDVFPNGGRIHGFEHLDVDLDGRAELVASFTSSREGVSDGYTAICKLTDDNEIASCVDVATDILGDPRLECVSFARGQVTPPCDLPALDVDDLAVVCRAPDISLVAHIRGDGNRFYVRRTLITLPNKRLSDIQLGDVTGDGLDDLVTLAIEASIPQLEVYPQQSSRKSNLCVPEPELPPGVD